MRGDLPAFRAMTNSFDLHKRPARATRLRRVVVLLAVVVLVALISCLVVSALRQRVDTATEPPILGLTVVASGAAIVAAATARGSISARRLTLPTDGCLPPRSAQYALLARAQQPSVGCVRSQAAHLGLVLTRSRSNSPPHLQQAKPPSASCSSRWALGGTARSRSISVQMV
jgi:hypothetical protein